MTEELRTWVAPKPHVFDNILYYRFMIQYTYLGLAHNAVHAPMLDRREWSISMALNTLPFTDHMPISRAILSIIKLGNLMIDKI